ncbi:hypothetical protein NW762_013090 [Fusarium torreyae]|uniref:Apple domain-containing protein n=1 Tax=Fusarium torreyae TaxID=1237075 RepID=A0A9W8RL29_9HYPO|nr:hypothetical protein NW762_013090 [Fusarium torreyae]
MVALKHILLGLALSAEALAVTDPSVVCNSKLGTSSVPSSKIPRATTTVDYKVTITKKFVRRVNVVVIPRPRTTTETETVKTTTTTVAPPNVETATMTETDEQTETVTQETTTTYTSTSFVTTTVTTSSTIAAPAGFTPLLQAPDYVAKVKVRAAAQAAVPVIPGARAGQQQYVQRIDCTKRIPHTTVKTTTTTVQGPRRTLQPKTKTKVITTTETIVETSYPPEVTETETETVSPTTTVHTTVTHEATTVETVTVETSVPGQTVYAACDSNNILRTANRGNPVVNIIVRSGTSYTTTSISGVSGAYNCCVQCMQNPACLMALTPVTGSSCYNYVATTPSTAACPNGQFLWSDYYSSTSRSPVWVWSNGPCGAMGNLGNR